MGKKKRLYLCTVSFHHASHMNSEPGWNFCFWNMIRHIQDQLLRILTPQYCRSIVDNTKDFMQWIKNKLSI